MRSLALSIGYFPIATAAIGIHVYAKYVLSKKYDFYIYAFSSLFVSIFLSSSVFYYLTLATFGTILLSQLFSISLIFILVKLAVMLTAPDATRVLADRGMSTSKLLLMIILPPSAVAMLNLLASSISPRCTGTRCAVLELIFGNDKLFTLYYFTNLYGSVFLITCALSIITFARRLFR